MASRRFKSIFGACVAGSLMFSSTAALASAALPSPQVHPWAVLTALSGAPAAAACGEAAAAAAAATQAPQAGCVLPVADAPPLPAAAPAAPPPAMPMVAASTGFSPLLFGLLAIAAVIGFFLVNNIHSNSPA